MCDDESNFKMMNGMMAYKQIFNRLTRDEVMASINRKSFPEYLA